LEEASLILGADEITTFWKVTVPQLWPGILSGGLLAFTMSFDDFVITSFVAGPGSSTLPLVVYSMVRRNIEPTVNAISTLILGGTTILIPSAHRAGLERARVAPAPPRRDFVRRASALGLSLPTISALLAACDRNKPDAVLDDPQRDLGPIEPKLAIYIWSDYVAPDTISNFEKEFGVKVTMDFYESAEEMLAKLQAG